jgi:putative FmdB family regulatory protein
MPIYEFHCSKCKENFETLVMSGSESVTCPHCHSKKLERLMSGFSRAGQGGGDNWGGDDSWDGDGGGDSGGYDSYGGGGCAGCAGGSCSTCH